MRSKDCLQSESPLKNKFTILKFKLDKQIEGTLRFYDIAYIWTSMGYSKKKQLSFAPGS